MLAQIAAWARAIGFVKKIADGLGIFHPAAAVLGPAFGAIGNLAAKIIDLVSDGLSACFSRPTAFLVVGLGMAVGFYKGDETRKAKSVSIEYCNHLVDKAIASKPRGKK